LYFGPDFFGSGFVFVSIVNRKIGQAQGRHGQLIASFVLQGTGVPFRPTEFHLALAAQKEEPFPKINIRRAFRPDPPPALPFP
jgi:hypothetical protein